MTAEPLSREETIVRGVFSRRHFAATTRRVKPNVFLEGAHQRRLSVDRADEATEEELVRLGEDRAKKRSRTFHGWARLSVAAAEDSGPGVEVWASPMSDNPYHADIVLPDNALSLRKHLANRLARTSQYYERPDTAGRRQGGLA